MRHLKAGRKLGRNASHRLALMRNLALALFRHERIITTAEKAKEARRFAERLITLAKRGTLHARRLALTRLGPMANAEVNPGDADDADHRTILQKLFDDIGPRFADRPGGYTRVIKRHERRLGDAGKTAFLELLKEGETKVMAKAAAPAPAPQVEDQEEVAQEEEQGAAQQEDQAEETEAAAGETQRPKPEDSAPGQPSEPLPGGTAGAGPEGSPKA
jgi:large subunit ribosomal protein L17